MRRFAKAGIASILVLTCMTGCWNLTEPDQLAFITAAGMDLSSNGRIEVSSQIAIPAAVGAQLSDSSLEKSFFVVSAEGQNVMDAGRNMQSHLSRSLFYEHRQAILIGQRMAERGIGDLLDMFVRNPKSEMRSTVAVVKDGKAKDLLNVKPRFGSFSGLAILRTQATEGMKPYFYRQFLSDSLSEGANPLLPAFRLEGADEFVFAGSALLDNSAGLKLTGYLDTDETCLANWILGRQTTLAVTSFAAKGNGTVTLRLENLHTRIRAGLTGEGEPSIEVRLLGGGPVIENNSRLDPSKSEDRRAIEQALSNAARQSAERMIAKVQHQYKTDIFGFGEKIHRRYPQLWKKRKRDWNRSFSKLPVSVRVTLHAKDPGQTNSAMRRFL